MIHAEYGMAATGFAHPYPHCASNRPVPLACVAPNVDMMVNMTPRHLSLVLLTLTAVILLPGCEALLSPRAAQERASRERARDYMHDADRYLEEGLLDSALAAFGLALEENPTLTAAHMGMGEIYRDRGDYDLASRAYERATTTDPTNFDAHYYLGLMRQLVGRVQEAIQAYLRALAINPDSMEANRDLAAAYLQAGQSSQALPYALRATRLNPEAQAAWCNLAATYSLLGRYEQAVDAYRQAAELGELAQPVMLGLADAHLQLDNYQRAINVLRSLLRRDDTSAIGHERLGYALFKLREFDEALAQYRQAVELKPQDPASLNGLGASLMTLYIQGGREDTDKRDRGIAAWRSSIRIEPNQPRIVDLLSRYSRL